MFNAQVNASCNNVLFSPPTMAAMQAVDAIHPSFSRLLDAARPHGDTRPADIVKRLSVSAQTMTNWRKRGVSQEGARKAQRAYGCDANAILGTELGVSATKRVSEPISRFDATFTDTLPPDSQRVRVRGVAMVDGSGFWRELQESTADEFVGALGNDPDAYAIKIVGRRFFPVIDSGQCVVASPRAPLRIHKRVLVRLADGRHTVRLYLNHQDGLWLFASLTDANDIMEMQDDQVTAVERVVAVSDSD